MDASRRADDLQKVSKTVLVGSDGGKKKLMKEFPRANGSGTSVAHDLRDSEAVRKLELLRAGLPETCTETDAVTDDLDVLHYYPGAALYLPAGGMR